MCATARLKLSKTLMMGKAFLKPEVLVLAVLIGFPLFSHLSHLPIRLWDESRLACNALEMTETGNLLVTQYEGAPDMWNTKPPLMIWLQVASIKIFGASEFAVRFPSAMAGLVTCVLIFWFGRVLAGSWVGFAAALVLVTAPGYTGEHATRTGDYDALLTMFLTAGLLLWFMWCEVGKAKHLYGFFVVLILGVMTKGVAGLLFLPGLGIFALIQKRGKNLFKSRHFYWGMLLFIIPVASYYLGREALNPGYLEAVYDNELGGRYANALENHHGGFWFYWESLVSLRFSFWYVLVPCGMALGLGSANLRLKKFTMLLILVISTYFVVISGAASKLVWYDVPLYPLLAFSIAVIIGFVSETVLEISPLKWGLRYNVLPFILVFLLFLEPYKDTVYRTYKPLENAGEKEFYEMSRLLQKADKGNVDLEGQRLVFDGHYAHLLFYVMKFQSEGIDFDIVQLNEVRPGQKIVLPQKEDLEWVKSHFELENEQWDGNVLFATVAGAIEQELTD